MSTLIPVRYPSGVNTAVPASLLANLQQPSPIKLYTYANDFSTYAAGDWTVTSTNSGTTALTDGLGGKVIQTTGATSTNYQANQLAAKSFYFNAGYQAWFWYNFNISDTAHTLMLAGLVDTLAGPMSPSKGVYFQKTDASTTLSLVLKGAGTTTVTVGTIAAATDYAVGFYYDARTSPRLWVYSSIGTTAPVLWENSVPILGGKGLACTLGAYSSDSATLANLPTSTDGLTLGFGITTGASAAHTNTVDYIGASMEVARL